MNLTMPRARSLPAALVASGAEMSAHTDSFRNANRRRWAAGILASGLAARAFGVRPNTSPADQPGESKLIVRNDRPLNLETPIELLDTQLTPVDRFFVRSHFGPPAVQLRAWSLRVEGLVSKLLDLPIQPGERTAGFGSKSVVAVLQCAGNGRAFFEPAVPGVPWRVGAVGNAEWAGFSLRSLLEAAGPSAKAAHVHFYGADAPPHPKTPAYVRSLPIARALDPDVLLATHMNGEPLPVHHGGPLRLVVPGWTGNHWMKWVRTIVVSDEEAPGSYQRTAYKIPIHSTAPDETPKPEDLVPVTELNLKSLITQPVSGSTSVAGVQTVRGVAWTGMDSVDRVEVSIDAGPWQAAVLEPRDHPYAWRRWTFSWEAEPGRHAVWARATDSSGRVQPEQTAWNKSGYLWNGIDSVEVEIRR
jgi:DMSO/TMAO reductase YedYZ molybdopterin-dependent catalytic subunit